MTRLDASKEEDEEREPTHLLEREQMKSRTLLIFGEVTTDLAREPAGSPARAH